MTGRRAAGVVALAAGLLVGCSGPAPTSPPTPAPVVTSAPTADAAPAPAPDSDADICARHAGTGEVVRGVARAAQEGPVLPAGVALVLLDARAQAQRPADDPALALAQAELLAAIDDLAAQGRAGLPSGGNPVEHPVQLDVARVLAAVDGLERACAAVG